MILCVDSENGVLSLLQRRKPKKDATVKLRLTLSVGIITGVFAASAAFAATPGVMSHVSVYTIARDGHIEPLLGAPHRGQKVEYRVTYTNLSHSLVNNLHATLRIPSGLILVKTLNSPRPSASMDDLRFHRLVLRSTGAAATGYPAVFEPRHSYRVLRWNLPYLTPGMTRVVYAVFTVGR